MRIPHHRFSYEDYLQREQETRLKHEWLDGDVLPIPDAAREHARLSARIACTLKIDRIFASHLKVRVVASDFVAYPDLTIVRGPLQLDARDRDVVVNPTILVEVMSPATAGYDRSTKWSHYRQIPSLQAYLLVDQIRPRVEMYERTADGFLHRMAEAGQTLRIPGLSGELDIDALYATQMIVTA